MNIETWHQWALVYAYEIGQLLFLIALIVLAVKMRKLSLVISAMAFLIFIIGNATMLVANKEYVELGQRSISQLPMNEMTAWRLGRIGSSLGFFVAGLGLFWFGISIWKKPQE